MIVHEHGSPYHKPFKILARIRKLDESGYGAYSVTICPQVNLDEGMQAWVHEDGPVHILEFVNKEKMRIGETKTILAKMQGWSESYWTECGYEHDAGFILLDCKTIRKTYVKPRRNYD
jgi:hypothetical protein